MKRKDNNKNRILLYLILATAMCVMITGCEKREEFRHGHRHRIGDPPIEEDVPSDASVSQEPVLEPKFDATAEAKKTEIQNGSYAFEGLADIYHQGMAAACDEIKADTSNIRNFVLMSSSGEKEVYRFEYLDTEFEVNFLKDGTVQYITTVPADGLIYRDGCKGLDIADFCIDKNIIPDLQAATDEAFQHGAIKSDFKIDYYWDKAQISRVYDFYIVRVNGKAIYNYTERRTEPQVVCELKYVGTEYNPRYFSVQNGERLEEFGQHEVPMCELEPKE